MEAEQVGRPARRRVSAVFGAAALAFVLPFMLVSCGGLEVATFNGLELTFGTEFEGEPVGPYPPLQVALLLAVVAAGLAWFGATGPAGVSAVVGAGAIAFFMVMMQVSLRQSGDDFVSLTLRFEIGIWLALGALVGGAVLCANMAKRRSPLRDGVGPEPRLGEPTPS